MPVIYQARIERDDCKANSHVLYVFGDNEMRRGYGGQARAMRGEPNAVGIRTKRGPALKPEDFWSDENFEANRRMIEEDLAPVRRSLSLGRIVVIPLDGLGTGFASMKTKCPKTFAYLQHQLSGLE